MQVNFLTMNDVFLIVLTDNIYYSSFLPSVVYL